MDTKDIKVMRWKGRNLFIGVKKGTELSDEWRDVTVTQERSILETWEESFVAGNIGTRWNMWIPEEILDKADEVAVFYASDKISNAVLNEMTKQGISAYALSKKSGVQQIQISRFIKGDNDLSLDAFTRILNALGKGYVAGDLIDIDETN